MYATALIVFREVLEAALIISIILAATRGVPRRGRWVMLGITGGALGAGVVAALTTVLASLFDGSGQEIVNAGILFIATMLIGWHIVWMSSHGKAMANEMREVGASVSHGTKRLSVLAIVVGLAVMREGSEIVLMLQGLWASGAVQNMLAGGLLGFVGGTLAGSLLYLGFIALPIGRIFTVTNWLLIMIAAGMAARGANFLAQAGLVPSFGSRLWDSSMILSDQSIVGQMLAALIGYIARPNGIELGFYLLTIVAIAIMTRLTTRRMTLRVVATGLVAASIIGMPHNAHAGLEVLSPYVTQGEVEFENQGYLTQDHNAANNNEQDYIGSIGYSPTSWYHAELESEFTRNPGPGQTTGYSSLNLENTLAVTEPGEYWIDTAVYYEMDFAHEGPNNIQFGVLGGKTIGPIAETFNLLLHKDFGAGDTPTGFIYSNQAKYRLREWFEPGFEVYGDTMGKDRFQDQQFATGPGIFGAFHLANSQSIKYQLAYLFGTTDATPSGAVRWLVEYETSF
jgi:high-affinity iron transporter